MIDLHIIPIVVDGLLQAQGYLIVHNDNLYENYTYVEFNLNDDTIHLDLPEGGMIKYEDVYRFGQMIVYNAKQFPFN